MKIRLAILENDLNYLKRLVGVFSTKYDDRLEVHSFTNKEVALASLAPSKINVFLCADEIEMERRQLPKGCEFAYFSENASLKELRGEKVVCKYQAVDEIYKQILNLYAENAQGVLGGTGNGAEGLFWFCSAGGGTGSTTVAAAAAAHYAAAGKKVLFVTLDPFSDASVFFNGGGVASFSDVLAAASNRHGNLALKMESSVRYDELRKVYFFAAPQIALDFMDLDSEVVEKIVMTLKNESDYDVVIIDRKFSFGEVELKLWECADQLIFVSDGSETGNVHFSRAYQAMELFAQKQRQYAIEKLALIYNQFSSGTGKMIQMFDSDNKEIELNTLGGIHTYLHATPTQLVDEISRETMFDKIC